MKKALNVMLIALMGVALVGCKDKNSTSTEVDEASKKEQAMQKVMTPYVHHAVIPVYEGMADAAMNLAEDMGKILAASMIDPASEDSMLIHNACEHWTESRKNWERSEAWLYGPADYEGIDPHIDSWPFDKTGFDDVISDAAEMAKYSRALVDNTTLDEEEYGLLGYHALEYVLYENGKAHKNNFYHTLEVLENVVNSSSLSTPHSSLYLRWAALLHDIGKTKTKRWAPAVGWTFHNHNYIGAKMVPQIFRRLKLPMGAEMKYVEKLVDMHMRPQVIADNEVTDSAVRRLLNDAGDDIDDLMTLCEADITSKNEARKKMFLENFRMVREKLTDLKAKDYKRLLQPVIDGNEIMELFHLKPSREVGLLKQYLKDAVLDNRVENAREPLMRLLMEKARQMGLSTTSSR